MDAQLKASYTSENEQVRFIFGKVKGERVLGKELVIPGPADYSESNPVHVAVTPEFVAREFLPRINAGKLPVAVAHSQPMKWPSGGDLNTHRKAVRFYPYQMLGTFCDGKLSFFRLREGQAEEVRYKVLDSSLYDRQVLLWGEDTQFVLSTTNVALLGCGGGNTLIAYQLAGMGFDLTLVDPDRWEESNRNRALVPRKHVGMLKVVSVAGIIKAHYPIVDVRVSPTKIEDAPPELLKQADVFIVGPDSITGRIAGNLLAASFGKPAVFPAAGIEVKDGKLERVGGTCQVFVPGETPCYQCHLHINQERVRLETSDDRQRAAIRKKYGVDLPIVPAIPSLNSVIGGVAAWEIVKLATKIERPVQLTCYDALTQTMSSYSLEPNARCLVCGHFKPRSGLAQPIKEKSSTRRTLFTLLRKKLGLTRLSSNEATAVNPEGRQ